MVDFQLTESQQTLREDVRRYAQTAIKPIAIELDQNEEYPEEIIAELGERGYGGITLPKLYRGMGKGVVELVLIIEELAAALMPVASALALHIGVAEVINRFGTDAQKDRFLPPMAGYETVGALGLSEKEAGSNKLEMETTAKREGNRWVLNGHKRWITNYRHADYVLTYAKTSADEDAPHNISAFLVPADEFDIKRVWDTLGANSVKSPKATLSDVHVPEGLRVGEPDRAYVQRSKLKTGLNVAARGVGIARAALEDTVEYTEQREQNDRSISEFQGVTWEVGEMATKVDTARLLTLRAAATADQSGKSSREYSMAKVHATQAAIDNANTAMQLHGGIGYTTEKHVERYLRDARLLSIAGGPNESHKDTLGQAVYKRYQPRE